MEGLRSTFSDEAIENMSDSEFLAACARADELNRPAEAKLMGHHARCVTLCGRCKHDREAHASLGSNGPRQCYAWNCTCQDFAP
jgi:hypothetical protein